MKLIIPEGRQSLVNVLGAELWRKAKSTKHIVILLVGVTISLLTVVGIISLVEYGGFEGLVSNLSGMAIGMGGLVLLLYVGVVVISSSASDLVDGTTQTSLLLTPRRLVLILSQSAVGALTGFATALLWCLALLVHFFLTDFAIQSVGQLILTLTFSVVAISFAVTIAFLVGRIVPGSILGLVVLLLIFLILPLVLNWVGSLTGSVFLARIASFINAGVPGSLAITAMEPYHDLGKSLLGLLGLIAWAVALFPVAYRCFKKIG